MVSLRFRVCVLALSGILATGVVYSAEDEKLSGSDRRWLERDVTALITEEEIRIFKELGSEDDRKRFKELFWLRRDPDLITPKNEFREEYEKRIKAANRSLRQRGARGSTTDMGKVFLLLGLPGSNGIQRTDGMGGLRYLTSTQTSDTSSEASVIEGRDSSLNAALASDMTATWSYEPDPERGIPEGLTIEFEQLQDIGYRFREPEPIAEELERVKKSYVFQPGIDYARDARGRLEDLPIMFDPRSPAKKALRELTESKVERTDIAFETETAFFRSTDGTYAPICFEIAPERLSWKEDVARVTLFGTIDTMDGDTLYRFEEPTKLSRRGDGPSITDLPVQLAPGSYTFNLGILDDASGRVGTRRVPVFVRGFDETTLDMSSVLLYTESNEVDDPPGTVGRSFQFDQVRFRAAPGNRFTPEETMGLLFFVYGFGLDSRDQPHLTGDYVLFKDDETLTTIPEQPLQANRKQAIGRLEIPLETLRPGKYRVQIEITDRITNENLKNQIEFLLEPEFYPVGEYADLVDSYQEGNFIEAAQALSRVRKESLERAAGDYRRGSLDERELKAAALLHTEAAFLTRKDVLFHLKSARDYVSRIEEPAVRSNCLRRWYLAVSNLLRGSTQSWAALHLVQDASEVFPEDLEILLAVGTVYEAAGWMGIPGKLEQAEELYRSLLATHPESIDVHLRLGRVMQLRGNGPEALRELKWSVDHAADEDSRFVAHMLLGETCNRIGRIQDSIRSYQAALAIDPHCQAAAVALSHALHRSGDRAGSRKVIRQFLTQEAGPQREPDHWMRFVFGGPELLSAAMQETREELLQ